MGKLDKWPRVNGFETKSLGLDALLLYNQRSRPAAQQAALASGLSLVFVAAPVSVSWSSSFEELLGLGGHLLWWWYVLKKFGGGGGGFEVSETPDNGVS